MAYISQIKLSDTTYDISAIKLKNARTLTIGNTGKSFNGTANVSWPLHDILYTSTVLGETSSWNITTPGIYAVGSNNAFSGEGNPENANGDLTPYRWGQLIVSKANTYGLAQFYVSHQDSNSSHQYGIKYRTGWNNNYVNTWETLLDSGNYNHYSPTLTGTGAYGTWGINITGNAATATKATQDGSGNTITSKYVTVDTTQTISGVKTFTNTTTFLNPIRIGNNANGDTNYIAFYGTTGDNPGSYNHTYIGENIWGGSSESSELVLFKGNDPATTASTVSGAGPDRIRHIAAGHLFQVYKSALSGTFTEICDSTVPVNKFEVNQSGANVYGNLTVSGGINGKSSGAVSVAEIYDSTTQKKDILAYCDTNSNIHKLQNYGHSGEVNFARFFSYDEAASNYNLPCVDSHTHIYSIDNANNWIRLLSLDIRNNDIWTRSKTNGTWNNWVKLLDSSNYTNYTVTKTGGGASGTWPISISGHAATATTSSNSNWLNTNSTLQYGASGLNYFNISGTAGSAANANQTPTADWYHIIRMNHANSNGYYTDIASCFHNNNMYMKRVASGSSSGWLHIWVEGNSVTSAVWNDYAECRESDCEDFGYVLMEVGDDSLTKTTERLSHFAGVSSDTWGFSQGETDKAKTPIAVAGRVLVYPYQDRNNYKPGDCVCAAPGGTVDIMTREEVREWPDRIVGTVSCVPDYEEWGGGEGADRDPVKVNGRIWIKVK